MFLYTALLGALAVASAAPTSNHRTVRRWTQSSAQCHSFYSDIAARGTNANLDKAFGGIPANQQAQTQLNFDFFATQSPLPLKVAASGKVNVSETYSIYFEYCEPLDGNPKGVFQAIHGIVATAGYWNLQIDGVTDYSFAESAAAAGWATLAYDRLGVGNSSHPEGSYNIMQVFYEASQALGISQAIRNGYLDSVPAFKTVVGLGHSYGSQILSVLWAAAPNAFDQVVLTGFTANQTLGPDGFPGFDSTLANYAYPDRFGNLGNVYTITPTVSADQFGFFHYPNYTQDALETFTTTKGEYAFSAPISSGAPPQAGPNFTKPLFVVTGEFDGPFCQGNCYSTSLGANMTQLDSTKKFLPGLAASNFATYVVPDTGHGINFHTTAYETYQRILAFVTSHM